MLYNKFDRSMLTSHIVASWHRSLSKIYTLWKYHEIFYDYENVTILYFGLYKTIFFFINKYYQFSVNEYLAASLRAFYDRPLSSSSLIIVRLTPRINRTITSKCRAIVVRLFPFHQRAKNNTLTMNELATRLSTFASLKQTGSGERTAVSSTTY